MFGDVITNALGQMIGEVLGESLEHKLDRRMMLREVAAAVQRAEARFAREYTLEDAELTAVLTQQTQFADLPSVRGALRDLLTRPFSDPTRSISLVRQSFSDVLPERLDRARIDAAVHAFLTFLGEEVLYVPQLRETYTLFFQKISAESNRNTAAQTEALAQHVQYLRDDMRQIVTARAERLLPQPAPTERSHPWHNLPQRSYAQFVGRQTELAKVRQLMRPHPHSRHFVVTIDGIGGVGKSALALELAHSYREQYSISPADERFDLIVWVSAKRTLLTANGIQQRRQTFTTLDDLYRAIATVCDQPTVLQAGVDQRRAAVEQVLTTKRTLLLIDNLETVDDEQLLTFLRELPDPTKAIITTRHRIDIAYALRLTGMPEPDALALIEQEATTKELILPPGTPAELFRRTGGLPLAIVWSIGLISVGHNVEAVVRRLGNGDSDIARFCFSESVARIRGGAAERVLLALALFERSVSRTMLGAVAGLADDRTSRDDGLAKLVQLSLINQKDDRFDLLPLTQRFALDLLEQQPTLEGELRERWTRELVALTQPYAVVHHLQQSPQSLVQEGKHLITLANWLRENQRGDIFLDILPALLYYQDTMGDWADLLHLADEGLEQAALLGRELETTRILCSASWVHSQQGRHTEAEQTLQQALGVARRAGEPGWEVEALSRLAQTVRRTGDFRRANAFCDEAYALCVDLPEPLATYSRADLNNERGKIHRDQADWIGARTFFQEARTIFSIEEDSPTFNIERAWGVLGNVAFVMVQLGEHVEAERLYRQSLEYFRQFGGRAYTATLLVRLAALELQQGKHDSGREHAREGLELSQKLNLVQERAQAEVILAQLDVDDAGERA